MADEAVGSPSASPSSERPTPLICKFCAGTYYQLDNRLGARMGPPGGVPFCPRCTDFPPSADGFEASPTGPIYVCLCCGGTSLDRDTMTVHVQQCLVDDSCCPFCGEVTDSALSHLTASEQECDPCIDLYWHPTHMARYYRERLPEYRVVILSPGSPGTSYACAEQMGSSPAL